MRVCKESVETEANLRRTCDQKPTSVETKSDQKIQYILQKRSNNVQKKRGDLKIR